MMTTTTRSTRAAAILLFTTLTLGACGGGRDDAAPADTAMMGGMNGMNGMAGMDSGQGMAGMGGMKGMEGMPGMGGAGSGAAARMRAHMAMVMGDRPDSLRAMLPMHRQETANLIAATNREMRDMNMTADAAWTATVDSLRADLRAMPELDGAALAAMFPAHRARIERLLAAHEAMTRAMGGSGKP